MDRQPAREARARARLITLAIDRYREELLIRFAGMGRRSVEIASALLLGAVVLLACNSIIGVEDVRQKSTTYRDGGSSGTSGVGDDDDDDDIVSPIEGGPTEPSLPMLALGASHSCARMVDGTVRCWGESRLGQLGDGINLDGGPDPQPSLKPKSVPGITDAVAIGAGSNHTCVIRTGGKLSCWGFNYSGQLGTGNKNTASAPVDVPNLGEVTAVAGGGTATCVALADKTASCWGDNDFGQLGDGSKNESSSPVKVKDLTGVVAVAVGSLHSCAVVDVGDVYCWGNNDKGQLGNGSTTQSSVPQKVGGLTDAVQVVAAASFSCARQKNGRVACWGNNDVGQLGNGVASPTPNPSPILVASLTDAVSLGAGLQHACAVRQTGEVVCWGEGDWGQLGSGRDAGSPMIVTVASLKDAHAVWGGAFRTCAVRTSGKAQCWGTNNYGELGDGSKNRAYLPVDIVDFP